MANLIIVHGVQFGDDKDAIKGSRKLGDNINVNGNNNILIPKAVFESGIIHQQEVALRI